MKKTILAAIIVFVLVGGSSTALAVPPPDTVAETTGVSQTQTSNVYESGSTTTTGSISGGDGSVDVRDGSVTGHFNGSEQSNQQTETGGGYVAPTPEPPIVIDPWYSLERHIRSSADDLIKELKSYSGASGVTTGYTADNGMSIDESVRVVEDENTSTEVYATYRYDWFVNDVTNRAQHYDGNFATPANEPTGTYTFGQVGTYNVIRKPWVQYHVFRWVKYTVTFTVKEQVSGYDVASGKWTETEVTHTRSEERWEKNSVRFYDGYADGTEWRIDVSIEDINKLLRIPTDIKAHSQSVVPVDRMTE